jgi:hypothetical protein
MAIPKQHAGRGNTIANAIAARDVMTRLAPTWSDGGNDGRVSPAIRPVVGSVGGVHF